MCIIIWFYKRSSLAQHELNLYLMNQLSTHVRLNEMRVTHVADAKLKKIYKICVTYSFASRQILCHIFICVTYSFVSHIHLCHIFIWVTYSFASHIVLRHIFICVSPWKVWRVQQVLLCWNPRCLRLIHKWRHTILDRWIIQPILVEKIYTKITRCIFCILDGPQLYRIFRTVTI